MTAITVDRNTPHKDGALLAVPMAAATKILAGTIVAASVTGYATPGATAVNLTYLGMADETVDNSTGAAGDVSVLVRRGRAFQFANSAADPVTQASLGKAAYIEDNQTVAATDGGATRSKAGIVHGVGVDGVWIL